MIYDPFQQKAIDCIKEGRSVIVSAPTGAGKTAIAEYVICDCLARDRKVVYTAPIKALSNQKFRDFQENFRDRIGILTGDVSINPDAPVLIMTTEIFRNKVFEKNNNLEEYSWIIFDEIHYIDDYQRGSVWEESLMFLPRHMRIVGLSATIPNIDELAEWFKSVHKGPLEVIKEEKRPVPLSFLYQYNGRIVDDMHKLPHHLCSTHGKMKPNRPAALIKDLSDRDRLPCIYFVFGRRRCEYLAQELMNFDFLNAGEKEKIRTLYKELCARFDLTNDKTSLYLESFAGRGIAYHHAGMLPALKEVVERLFTSRLIKVIFTTETFALGINMPARTVVFDSLSKHYGRFYGALKTRDFYQMAGRAGRRGIDREGFVYSRVNPRDVSFQDLKRIIFGAPERIASRFNASYATILNLYEKYRETLYDIYPLSFHYFGEDTHRRRAAVDLLRSKVKILERMGYIDGGRVTRKGAFAKSIYGYELSLSEIYEEGLLERSSALELGILALALVFETRAKAGRPTPEPGLTRTAKRLRDMTDRTVSGIHKQEKRLGIRPLSKKYLYHLTPALEAWMANEDFDTILRRTDVDEGEVIRYFRMAVQILREILGTPASSHLKENALKAIMLINRDVVDAEKQLRE